MAKPGRPGARNPGKKKGPLKGTGGHSRKALEGRGPTPKAEDRAWHPAGKRKAAEERYAAAGVNEMVITFRGEEPLKDMAYLAKTLEVLRS